MHTMFVGLAGLAIVALTRPIAMDQYLAAQPYEDLYYLPAPSHLGMLSLGHRAALADFVWMKALIYLGDEFQNRGNLEHVYRYTDAILALDPDFEAAYEWVAMAGLYRPSNVTAEEARAVLPYLRQAAERFPDDGAMAWTVGATMVYDVAPFLDDEDEAAAVRREGVEHLQHAARLGAGPPWLVLSNLSQLRRVGEVEQMVRHIEEMLPLVDDPQVRAELLARLEQARGAAAAEAMRVALEVEEARWLTTRPWVPFEFFLVMDPSDR